MIQTSVDIIRNAYPSPTRADLHVTEYNYCVGGAFCMYMSSNDHSFKSGLTGEGTRQFPTCALLTDAIMLVTGMGIEEANMYADNILCTNDAGRFDAAWDWLDRALTYQKTSR